jgi:hypothetical protein
MSIVHLRMVVVVVVVVVVVAALERIRAREDVLKCVGVEELVVEDALMEAELVVEDALMEAELVVEDANGCLFNVTAMSNVTREAMIAVADEARIMLNVLHAPIGPLRMPKLPHLHPRPHHPHPQKRKPVMSRRPLELFRRRHLVKLNHRFK